MLKHGLKVAVLTALSLVLALNTVVAQDIVLEFSCYQDGPECEVYAELLERFSAENEGIVVEVATIPYNDILNVLPVAVEAGEGPDIARITSFPNFADSYLDMRPYMMDAEAFEANFSPAILASFRDDAEDGGLHGFPDGFTVTAPFVNATLFEQAGVELLGEGASWEEWIAALTEVAELTETEYAFTMDNRGHRFAGPAMSQGAVFFDENGDFSLAGDEGFTSFASLLKGMIDNGQTPAETWATGDSYVAANAFFENAQTVMYFSGSWQIGNFASNIGDNFDWVVVPNPTGPGGSTGVAGGAALAAFDSGDDATNAAITAVMEYLASPEVYAEFSGRVLFVPGNSGAVEAGITYDTDSSLVADALAAFGNEATKLQDQALQLNIHPFAFAYYGESNTRISQFLVGEISLEELTELLQSDIEAAMANADA